MRRVETLLAAAGALVACLATGEARAAKEYYPRYGTELRLGPYRPVLSDADQVRRLRDIIWDKKDQSIIKKHPLMMGLELDLYLFKDFGLLGPYGRVGYWSQEGRARLCRDSSGLVTECTPESVFASEEGVDTASLTVVPVSLGVVYRYDMLRRSFNIPLVFNLKAGADYHLWWGGLGKKTAKYHGKSAQGGVLGYSASVGVAVSLEGLRAGAPVYGRDRNAQNDYIFAEYHLVRTPARGARLDFSDSTLVVIGLAVDFR